MKVPDTHSVFQRINNAQTSGKDSLVIHRPVGSARSNSLTLALLDRLVTRGYTVTPVHCDSSHVVAFDIRFL